MLGILIEVAVLLLNAEPLIVVTPSGMVTAAISSPQKADVSMVETFLPAIVEGTTTLIADFV